MARRQKKRQAKVRKIREKNRIRYLFYAAFVFVLIFGVYTFYEAGANFGMASFNKYDSDFTIAVELFFLFVVFSYLFARGKSLKKIIKRIGLSRNSISLRVIGFGVLIFLSVLFLGFVFSEITAITNIQFPTNVQQVLGGMPIYLLLFSVVGAPLCEEVFFRGFLVKAIQGLFERRLGKAHSLFAGITGSAIIFAMFHIGYLSISEFTAALFFGLVAGYAFVKTESLYTSLTAHIMVNALTILGILAFVHI